MYVVKIYTISLPSPIGLVTELILCQKEQIIYFGVQERSLQDSDTAFDK